MSAGDEMQTCWPTHSRRRLARTVLAGAAVAVVLLAGVLLPASAGAVPAVPCSHIRVHHKRYLVTAHVLPCKRATKWAASYLKHGSKSHGYVCQRFSPKLTRVRFTCYNPSTSSRTDGPQAFTASV